MGEMWMNGNSKYIPSFEEGAPRRSNKCNATSSNRRGGGGRTPVAGMGLTSLEAARCRACASRPAAPILIGSETSFKSAPPPLL
jgi:hypothetical protein